MAANQGGTAPPGCGRIWRAIPPKTNEVPNVAIKGSSRPNTTRAPLRAPARNPNQKGPGQNWQGGRGRRSHVGGRETGGQTDQTANGQINSPDNHDQRLGHGHQAPKPPIDCKG